MCLGGGRQFADLTQKHMSLNQPTKLFFSISLLLAILASLVLFTSLSIPLVSTYVTYTLLASWGLLATSCMVKGV